MSIYVRTEITHFVDACDLSDLFNKEYGTDCNIACYMEGERKIEADASKLETVGEFPNDGVIQAVAQFKQDSELSYEVLDALMCDQCTKGNLPEGHYIIKFDD